MVKDMIVNASLVPASEVLSQLVKSIVDIINAANDVLIEKKSFEEVSAYLERIVPVLKVLSKKHIHDADDADALNKCIDILGREIKVARLLVEECTNRNRVYLLVNCRKIVKRLSDTTKEISRAINLIPLASLDLSSALHDEINNLCENMLRAEFRAAIAEEEILDKIESGIQERNVDRSYANNLLVLIAQAVGISNDRTTLKKELDEFKNEIEATQLRKDQAEAIQMNQIIALLGRADAASSPKEKEIKYFNKRNSLGTQPLEPLPSFHCPITREVMMDPVETSSEQTFERSAIEKWLAEGKIHCPLTMIPLNPTILRPNKTLRQSIEEWKDRNTMITIASMKPTLQSGDAQEVLHSLALLQSLCQEKDSHREWVVLENYIPLLIGLLASKNHDLRKSALPILHILAKDSDENKERITEVENAIESIVHSLARRIGESKLAVALLLELSKSSVVCERIGKVQGCILLLVTMSSSNDSQASGDAKELLENLSVLDQNVTQMAKANYFLPLSRRLSSGPEDVKLVMAATIADMELSDYNKASLFEDGVLGPLLHLVSHHNSEVKKVAVKALQNLSRLPQNGLQMIREGAVVPLLGLLYSHSSSSPSLREHLVATIANLAISTTAHEAGEQQIPLLGNDDDIFRLFSLINMTGPDVQRSILHTFLAICQAPSATEMRSKLRQCSAIQVLVQLCEFDNVDLRASAAKLFCCLTQDAEADTLSEHVGQKCIETLLRIIDTSSDEEEISATMGIISNLPVDDTRMTEWLLDAGALPRIFSILKEGNSNGIHKIKLVESAVRSLYRFCVSEKEDWQKRTAETGFIPVLVQLLGYGTAFTKQHAAASLAQFSKSSIRLSRPIEKRGGFWCCSTPVETGCPVHMGFCTVELSFCLVEADAVKPLVRILGEPDLGACEASLVALLTLIEGERLQNGSKVLGEANAIEPIIKLLSCSSVELQAKALSALERIFRLVEFKQKYGTSAQMPLVDITQRGTSAMKSLAARILAHLNVLREQSSYF